MVKRIERQLQLTPIGRELHTSGAGRAKRGLIDAQALGGLIELGLLALAAPIFWLPWKWPLLTLLMLPSLPLSWSLAWHRRGTLSTESGLEAPLVYVLLATCVATIPVTDWNAALPKVLGMALGATTLVSIANVITSRTSVRWAIALFALLTLGISVVGLLGVAWNTTKTPAIASLYARLPGFLRGSVPGTSEGTIHPNELAGVLVLVSPPVLAYGVALFQVWLQKTVRGLPVGALLTLLAGTGAVAVVLLTQSRSGVAGTAASVTIIGGLVLVAMLRSPRFRFRTRALAGVIYLSIIVGTTYVIVGGIGRWVASGPSSDTGDTFAGRLELWDRSISMLQDFPFTGIGIGQFDRVLHALYVPLLNGPLQVVPHAHNVFFEYALELGIPGAVAVMFLVLAFWRQCLRAARSSDPALRWIGIGLGVGVLGYVVYGLVDAIAPGARAGIILWIVLGLGAAVGNVARTTHEHEEQGCSTVGH